MKTLSFLVIISLIIGCTATPIFSHDPDNITCHLETKKRKLIIKEELKSNPNGKGGANELLIAVASVYTVATVIVSGSIVLVGNTVHWLEKQGKCDDAFVRRTYNGYIEPLINSGGIIVDEPKDN